MQRPTLAITMGDVAGIGPEICAKALARPEVYESCRPLVIGSEPALRRSLGPSGLEHLDINLVDGPEQLRDQHGTIDLLDAGAAVEGLAEAPLGEVSAAAGAGSVAFVRAATALGRDRVIDGIVTAPLNKAAMHAAGYLYPGHTELLAEEFGVERFSLVLSAGDLYLLHVTTHIALRDACDAVTETTVGRTIDLAAAFARALGVPDEPIMVAGLNPHAGENGLFGSEDQEVLTPAIERARDAGLDVRGPLPADALVPQAFRGAWRFVVVCYHDQGHVAFKSYFGDDGVNITAGIPVVRTSVDHGTAFDVAGQGIAREDSLVLAIDRAADLAPGWDRIWQQGEAGDD